MRKSAPLFCALLLSLSARRAWIEIGCGAGYAGGHPVALRKESVDRNMMTISNSLSLRVALRKESVDRNIEFDVQTVDYCVALRKESVDRNKKLMTKLLSDTVALRKESVDRNKQVRNQTNRQTVALRKESVDRNAGFATLYATNEKSLSARRAWIEILLPALSAPSRRESLSARRAWIEIYIGRGCRNISASRSPQGERG